MVPEPIAIIGTGCRFPGESSSPSRLWDLLKSPRVVASEAPAARFDIKSFFHEDPSFPGTTNARESYYLSEDPRPFDAPFFNISATEAESIDPQQRQLLETVYESLESAGLRLDALQGSSTGIFCGVMNNDWGELLSADHKCLPQYLATGAARSIIANRVSYFFDWHGPSVVVDTACSSSMVALHQAVTSLQQHESSLALATGTNLIQAPNIFISTTKIRMLSPTGRSRMWDAQADGYARGEGVVSIVLKRLSEAIADGDSIECIIRATGTNQDGRTMGLTMPSSESQLQLIESTYARAGLNPKRLEDRCQYFEAHGTGTLAGDPQEASAIHHAFFGAPTPAEAPSANGDGVSNGSGMTDILLVGSIKTVIGHTEGTAGLAGVLKACLSLQNGVIAPNLLFESLNPALQPYASRLRVATEPTAWPALPPGVPRRVSVNSFGFGGSNAHAILESYEHGVSHNVTAAEGSHPDMAAVLPFVFSAASEKSLIAVLRVYADYLKNNRSVDLIDLASSLLQRRSALRCRISLSAASIDELIDKMDHEIEAIRAKKSTRLTSRQCSNRQQILGIFTGQGAQWAQMGWDVFNASPQARGWLNEMQESLDQLPTRYRPSFSLVDALSDPDSKLNSASLSQPLCTALQIILVNFMTELGISFTSVVGHSSGEIAAAYAAGFLSARDAIRIAYLRGLVASMATAENGQPGAMLAAGMSAADAADVCSEYAGQIALAASNAPSTVTFSGDADAIQSLEQKLKAEGTFCRMLRVETAYHSHHMEPCSKPYLDALEECSVKPRAGSSTTWHSSVYPGVDIDKTLLGSDYWKENMVRPVLFSEAVSTALDTLPDLVVEVGPHPALKGPVQQNIADLFPGAQDVKYLAPCSRGASGLKSLASVIGSIWEAIGPFAVDIAKYIRLFDPSPKPKRPTFIKGLPTYPFDHSRSYLTQSRLVKRHLHHCGVPHPLLGTLEPQSADGEWRWRHYLRRKDLEWLDGHRIQSQTVFPATGYLIMALEAAALSNDGRPMRLVQLDEIDIHQAIVLPDDEYAGIEILFRLSSTDSHDNITTAIFHIHASTGDAFQVRASGRLTVTRGERDPSLLPPPGPLPASPMRPLNIDEFYSFLSGMGYGYTGLFRGLVGLARQRDISRGEVQNLCDSNNDRYPFLLHPALLDCTLQSMLGAIGAPNDGELYTLLVPTRIKSVRINPALCGPCPRAIQPGDVLLSDAAVTKLGADGISGDVVLFTQDGAGVVQMEGVEISPLLQPHRDRTVFSEVIFGPLTPGRGSFTDPVGFSAHALTMEHIALLYVKLVHEQLTEDDRVNFDQHRSRLASWIDRTLALARAGEHPILDAAWLEGTQEDLDALLSDVSGSVMTEIANVVGTTLRRFFSGEASILEEVRKDDVLTRFYRYDLETNMMNERLGDVVGQIAFRYPRMKILEIGAGTGSATHSVLANIGRSYHSYTFTDISVGFFEEAKSAFAAHEDRFLFAPLNIEIDPAHQNFEAHSYDLIIAANVLHATRSMKETMTHVRQLLKPGGHLVMLEITNTDAIRTTFLMGGFEGWWAGEKDGRIWGPMLDIPSWDGLLRESEFGGVDLRVGLGDPRLCLYEVIVAQAVDTQMTLLREPLTTPSERRNDLLILGGETSRTSSLVDQLVKILSLRFQNISMAPTLEALPLDVPPQGAILSLLDIDRPCFQDLTKDRLQALQKVISATHRLLWVTAGSEGDCPYLGMSKGWLRSLAYERKESLHQYLNIESLAATVAKTLATALMRLVYADGVKDHSLPDRVYATEHELYYKNGTMQIVRLRNDTAMNQRYLSARRWVSKEVKLTDANTVVRVVPGVEDQYELHVDETAIASCQQEDHVLIHVKYSTLNAIAIGDGFLHLVIGQQPRTGIQLLALSNKHENVIRVPATWTCQLPDGVPPGKEACFLRAMVDVLFASWLSSKAPPSSNLLVHEAGPALRTAIRNLVSGKNVAPIFTTCNPTSSTQSTVYLHPHSSARSLKQLLPGNLSMAACFDTTAARNGVFARVAETLSKGAARVYPQILHQSMPMLPSYGGELRSLLRNACDMAARLSKSHPSVDLRDINSVAGQLVQLDVLVDWTRCSSVQARIEPATSLVTLSANKTYLLAGMTGDLGQSLCRWMPKYQSEVDTCDGKTRSESVIDAHVSDDSPEDLADRESVIRVYHTIQQQQLPPVGGVVNGALVLEDRLFEEMTIDIMQATLAAKVQGSLFLDELSGPNAQLDFFILFGSITGVVGNFKQTAYSTATGFQSSLIHRRRAQGRVGSIVHPGLISGVGYITRKGSRWAEHVRKTTGSLLLSERDLDTLFAEAILAGHPHSNRNPEIIVGLPSIDPIEQPDIFWYSNPLTWDFIDHACKTTAQGSGSNAPNSVKALLECITSTDEILPIISEALIAKVRSKFNLSEDTVVTSATQLRDLGIDSLVAVDLRTWFARELAVDIPLLQIMGDATIEDLAHVAASALPASMFPRVHSLRGQEKDLENGVDSTVDLRYNESQHNENLDIQVFLTLTVPSEEQHE
ncbi:hypothetical protein BDW75DRAFT_237396 [Aspergillus navahoensis]